MIKKVDVLLLKEPGDEDKNRQTEIALFDRFYLSDKRIKQFAREVEISIYLLKGAKVEITRRM